MSEISTVNRDRWLKTFTAATGPTWPCPWCAGGTLKLVKDSFRSYETAASRAEQPPDGWDAESIRSTFSCWLECNGKCSENVALFGTSEVVMFVDEDPEGNLVEDYAEICRPLAAHPMPDVFSIPSKTPAAVRDELTAAFRLVWLDPGAAADHLRVSLERLLDHLDIPNSVRSARGRQQLTLHGRIEKYAEKEPTLGIQLMAIKWLGNTASHEGSVSRETSLDAFEILDHALGEMLLQRSKAISKPAKKMTREHRNRRRKKR